MEENKNEVVEVNEKYDTKSHLTSTIIIGVFLLIMLVLTLLILPLDLKALQNVSISAESGGGDSSSAGEQLGKAFALIFVVLMGALAIYLLNAFLIVFNIACGIMLPFTIKNRRSPIKAIRIVNYCYLGVEGFIIISSVIKVIYLLTTRQA